MRRKSSSYAMSAWPAAEVAEDLRATLLAVAQHFAERRPFYRAMLTGSCAFAMSRALNDLFGLLNQETVRELFGEPSPQNPTSWQIVC